MTVSSQFYLESFFFLGRFRGLGMSGPLPLSFADVKEYAVTIGLRTSEAILFFADVMAELDSVFLLYAAKKQETATEQAKSSRSGSVRRR